MKKTKYRTIIKKCILNREVEFLQFSSLELKINFSNRIKKIIGLKYNTYYKEVWRFVPRFSCKYENIANEYYETYFGAISTDGGVTNLKVKDCPLKINENNKYRLVFDLFDSLNWCGYFSKLFPNISDYFSAIDFMRISYEMNQEYNKESKKKETIKYL